MKLCTVVLFLSLAACGKANDLPAMKAEAQGMAKNYQTKLGELDRRANHILQRGNAIGVTSPDAANASHTFATAKGRLEQLKASA
ncbi:MAG TPA: hypothetical protein VK427_25700, partial [Kofleriaceae bacterium]|nr:hypothetical protein [Kofleriaceae bacterium]